MFQYSNAIRTACAPLAPAARQFRLQRSNGHAQESLSANAESGERLGPRCDYLAKWFAQRADIEASQAAMLQRLSRNELQAKIGHIEDWCAALAACEVSGPHSRVAQGIGAGH